MTSTWPVTAITPAAAIRGQRLWPSPGDIRRECPLPPQAAAGVADHRAQVRAVLEGADDRLLVLASPPPGAGPGPVLQLAAFLAAAGYGQDLLIVLQLPGFAAVPGQEAEPAGTAIRQARQLAGCAAGLVPLACQWACPVAAWYLADTAAWGLVPARFAGLPAWAHLASGMPAPAAFASAADSGIRAAVTAVTAAALPQSYLGVTGDGRIGPVTTTGNPSCHLIVRGSQSAAGCARRTSHAMALLARAGLPARLALDAGPGSGRPGGHWRAAACVAAGQVAGGAGGITGITLGPLPAGPGTGIPALLPVLDMLAAAARDRRAATARVPGQRRPPQQEADAAAS